MVKKRETLNRERPVNCTGVIISYYYKQYKQGNSLRPPSLPL